ncbi:MAG: DUF6169 family protein [Lachnospiraceae bacterium]|nr:DUF6169 family protein [Lachnospiraceae bacterium]
MPKNVMSNLLHPYEYKLKGEVYVFTTIQGYEYSAYFIAMNSITEIDNLYQFSFESCEDIHNCYDSRVADTICTILNDFFKKNNNALIIVCDDTDNRGAARKRLFQQWYLRVQNNLINKYDKQFRSADYDIYASLLIHKDNADSPKILEVFSHFSESWFYPES